MMLHLLFLLAQTHVSTVLGTTFFQLINDEEIFCEDIIVKKKIYICTEESVRLLKVKSSNGLRVRMRIILEF